MLAESVWPSSSSRFQGLLITDLAFTDTKLGRGSDATVYEVDWNGTVCAAKRLHDALLEDESPGGADKLISNFETECLTWSKLHHPCVVQFLGVYLERSSRLPVLLLEKMDTSLRRYLESHSKEEFPLGLKAFVLRQVAQALTYLHSQHPPLVHHDLSTNNVLLNVASFVTKVSDFGMSRAINPSATSRKSSIKGTPAFMSPEALHDPPRYNEKLDVFSFGSIIISTVTHEWPSPDPPNRYEGNYLVALNELQRRYCHLATFTAEEKQLFLPTVNLCLENRPTMRPSSVMLVQEMRRIESFISGGSHVAGPIEQLCQQLSTKEEECRAKDAALQDKDVVIQGQQTDIQYLRDQLALLMSQQERCPPGDHGKVGECKKVTHHTPEAAWCVNSWGLHVADGGNLCADLLSRSASPLRSSPVTDGPLQTFQTDYRPLSHQSSEHDLPVSAPSSLSSTHLSQKVNGLNRACEGALLSGESGSSSDVSLPPLQLSPSNGSCSSPVRNVDEEDDSGVPVAEDINMTMIEQQLQTRIYEMSREEAKAALSLHMVNGMFLLRFGQHSGTQLVLSVWHKTECKHFKIFQDKEKGFSLTHHTFFTSVTDLISHYKQASLPKSPFHLSVPYG